MRFVATVLLGFVGVLVPLNSLALSPGQCYVNNNDSQSDQEVWTGSIRITKVSALKESGVLRLKVNPEVCDPSSCGRTDTIDLRLAAAVDGDDVTFRMMKKMVYMAYTRSTRVRFRMVAGGVCSGDSDDTGDDPIFVPVADGVSLPIQTAYSRVECSECLDDPIDDRLPEWSSPHSLREILATEASGVLQVILKRRPREEGDPEHMPNPALCVNTGGVQDQPGYGIEGSTARNSHLELPLQADSPEKELQVKLAIDTVLAAHAARLSLSVLLDESACAASGRPLAAAVRMHDLEAFQWRCGS